MQQSSLESVEKVALAIEEIKDEVIFIGGAVMELYVTDSGAEEPRPTLDVDVSVKISSYLEMEKLREKLARKNIYPAPTETILYRYSYEDILIDFIPYEPTPLGPTNKWLKPGFPYAVVALVGETEINILPVNIFLATKWEAYKSRGNDPRMSHDFEDIIYILDNNSRILESVSNGASLVKDFLKEMSHEILSNKSFQEIIECHLNPILAEERSKYIIEKLKKIIQTQ